MEHVCKSGTEGGGKEGKTDKVNNIEIYHICVGIRHMKCTENYRTIQGRGKEYGIVIERVRLIKVQYKYR
jgi:hypothetical protein